MKSLRSRPYGAIGATIGHEITHGFDDQGRKIDATGALRDWWALADAAHYAAESKNLVRQFDGYQPLPGGAPERTATFG